MLNGSNRYLTFELYSERCMDLSMLAAKMTPGTERCLFSLANCDNNLSEIPANDKYLKIQELVRYFEDK